MKREEINERFAVTEEQLDEWAEACKRGEYPGKPTGEIMLERPLMFGEEMRPITFKATSTKIDEINARAAELDLSRSDYLEIAHACRQQPCEGAGSSVKDACVADGGDSMTMPRSKSLRGILGKRICRPCEIWLSDKP